MSLKISEGYELRLAIAHFGQLVALRNAVMSHPEHPTPDMGPVIGFEIWRKLRRVENWVAGQCERYSSDPKYTSARWEKVSAQARARVQDILGGIPGGFFVNTDPRGYMLKLDDATCPWAKSLKDCGMHADMGGYLILAPENFK